MKTHSFLITILIWSVFLSGCFNDSNRRAGTLYNNAVKHSEKMISVARDYKEAYQNYVAARNAINEILSNYSSSDIAARLSSEEALIGRFTLNQFLELENPLKELDKAEKYPLAFALAVVNRIEVENESSVKTELKDKLLGEIAAGYAASGQFSTARKIVNLIQGEMKILELEKLARRYVEDGEFSKAIEISENVDGFQRMYPPFGKEWVLARIAKKQAEEGQFSLALETTGKINNGLYKYTALAGIARQYAKEGKNDDASRLLGQCLEMIPVLDNDLPQWMDGIETDYFRVLRMADIAKQYAKIGKKEKANQLVNQVIKIIDSDDENRLRNVVDIVDALIALGNFTDAMKLAESAPSDYARSSILFKIAEGSIKAGNFDRVFEIIDLADNRKVEEKIRAKIAERYAEDGDIPKALEIMKEIVSDDDSSILVIEPSLAMIAGNDTRGKYTSQILQTIRARNWDYQESRLLFGVSVKYAEISLKEDANEFLSIALQEPVSDLDKAMMLLESSRIYYELPWREKAYQLASQALKTYKIYGVDKKKKVRPENLVDVAVTFAEIGHDPSREELAYLTEILHSIYPINQFWEKMVRIH